MRDYFKLYDLKFAAGGPYNKSDTISGYVVNETLIHKLGITDPKQAIGKYIMLWNDKKLNAQITGVVKDFNVGSLTWRYSTSINGTMAGAVCKTEYQK
jgi:putative ABC transport system permease protein